MLVLVVGTLVGLEIPLLMRILRDRFEFKDVVANVLTFDYLGRARRVAAVPDRAGAAAGPGALGAAVRVINAARRALVHVRARSSRSRRRAARAAGACVVVLALLGVGLWTANAILDLAEDNLYADEVIYSRNTPYQRIVLTAWKDDLRLFLNSQPAVQLARRVPLPRGARAPGPRGAARGGARAGARRRRRTGRARGAEVSAGRAASRWSISIPR